MKLSSKSLKNIHAEEIRWRKFILEVDILEELNQKDCALDVFETVGKGMHKIESVIVENFEIHESCGCEEGHNNTAKILSHELNIIKIENAQALGRQVLYQKHGG